MSRDRATISDDEVERVLANRNAAYARWALNFPHPRVETRAGLHLVDTGLASAELNVVFVLEPSAAPATAIEAAAQFYADLRLPGGSRSSSGSGRAGRGPLSRRAGRSWRFARGCSSGRPLPCSARRPGACRSRRSRPKRTRSALRGRSPPDSATRRVRRRSPRGSMARPDARATSGSWTGAMWRRRSDSATAE